MKSNYIICTNLSRLFLHILILHRKLNLLVKKVCNLKKKHLLQLNLNIVCCADWVERSCTMSNLRRAVPIYDFHRYIDSFDFTEVDDQKLNQNNEMTPLKCILARFAGISCSFKAYQNVATTIFSTFKYERFGNKNSLCPI